MNKVSPSAKCLSAINKKGFIMKKYVCTMCGYVYDPEKGDDVMNIPAGIAFEDLPENWTCPICGVRKDDFKEQD